MIIEELNGYNGQIICLQEIESSIYYDYYLPRMKEAGFDGEFANNSIKNIGGLACFWRCETFEKIDAQYVLLGKCLHSSEGICKEIQKNKNALSCAR